MEPVSISVAVLCARLIAAHGEGLLDAGEDLACKLVDKGADALAGSAVAGVIGWLRAHARGEQGGEFEAAARAAITGRDEASEKQLAGVIERVAADAPGELAALVRVANDASAASITHIQFGDIKAGFVAQSGSTQHIQDQTFTVN